MPQSIPPESSSPSTTNNSNSDEVNDEEPKPDLPLDNYPAESFYLSKEDEVDWFDRNAFYERKDSTKGNSGTSNNQTSTTSQRFSVTLKSKPSIIGLPKTQKNNYAETKFRRSCKPVKAQFFPKRSRWSGRGGSLPLSEPGSPKVSCIGRVRSKKDRSRRKKPDHRRNHLGQAGGTEAQPVVRTGFWKSVKAALGLGRRKTRAIDVDLPTVVVGKEKSVEKKKFSVGEKPIVEPPGLGGLKQFSSGRRSESWGGGDVDLDGSESDSSNHGGSVWRRRGVGPPNKVDCGREWEVVGPASV